MLQMACEKLAKSHLCAAGADPLSIQASHAYTAKVLPVLLRQEVARLGAAGEKRRAWLVDAAGTLHTPVGETFPNLSALYTPLGTELLKTLERAVNRLSVE